MVFLFVFQTGAFFRWEMRLMQGTTRFYTTLKCKCEMFFKCRWGFSGAYFWTCMITVFSNPTASRFSSQSSTHFFPRIFFYHYTVDLAKENSILQQEVLYMYYPIAYSKSSQELYRASIVNMPVLCLRKTKILSQMVSVPQFGIPCRKLQFLLSYLCCPAHG